jgi:hypothetical protein
MSEVFDPYYKWLGILPKDQPPHHYRLLGLEPLEDDLQVIEGAADRQLSFLRKFQSGDHAALCQKLLNEVSRARLCLLKPASKAAYDGQLRALLEAPADEPAEPETEPAFDLETSPTISAAASTRRGSPLPIPAIVGSALLLLAVVAFVATRGGKADPKQAVVEDNKPAVAKRSDPATTNPDKSVTLKVGEMPATRPQTGTSAKNLVAGQIDILSKLREEHIISGNWKIEPDSLESLADIAGAAVKLPVDAPEEYTLHLEGVRFEGSGGDLSTLALGLACGGHDVLAALQVYRKSGGCGLQMVDQLNWEQNRTNLPNISIPIRQPFQLDAIVRKSDLEIRLNERTVIEWSGDFSRFQHHPFWKIAVKNQLFLSAESTYRFTKLTLGPPLPPRNLPGSDLKIDERAELLKFVDLERDVWKGTWLKDGLELKSNPDETDMRFSVPYQIPEEYELHADIDGYSNRKDFYLGLPFQQGYASLVMGGYAGDTNGLFLDRRDFSDVPGLTRRAQDMRPGPNHLVAVIRKNRLVVKINETTIFDWKGDPRRFEMPTSWAVPGHRISAGTWNSGYRIKSLKLTRLATTDSPFPAPSRPKAGDLLGIVNVDRDTMMGTWTKVDGKLVSNGLLASGIRFPAKLPDDFEFRLVLERKTSNVDVNVRIPVAGRGVTFALDSQWAKASGIEWFEGRRCNENSTTILQKGLMLPIGIPKVVTGRVKGRHLQVELEGKTLWDLHIPENLIDPGWEMFPFWASREERLQMHVGVYHSEVIVHEARFKPLDANSPAFPKVNLSAINKPTTGQSKSPAVTAPTTKEPKTGTNPDESMVGAGSLATGTTPVPEAAALSAALKQLQTVFAADYAKAKKDPEKQALAAKLEKLAQDTDDDLATKYVSFEEARKLYIDVGDLTQALAVIDAMHIDFKLNAFELKIATLKGAAPKIKSPILNRMFAEQALALTDQLLQSEQYSKAVDLAGLAAQAATKAKDKTLQLDAQELRKEALTQSEQDEAATKAAETLNTRPEDAAARLVRGKWLCVYKNNWPAGLLVLQGTDDKVLKDLVTRDLRNPVEKEAQQLATDWLAYAKAGKDHSQSDFAERALFWYAKVHSQATGLGKTVLEQSMEEAVKIRDWNSPLTALLKQIEPKVLQNKVLKSNESAAEGGDLFEELPANQGILIGFNYIMGNWHEYRVISGLQAVYATKLGTQTGPWHGVSEGAQVEVRAKPGYALSGIRGISGAMLDHLQFSFSRITRTGLDPGRTYLSALINSNDPNWQPNFVIPPSRQPIVGIFGHADTSIRGLGVIFSQ